MRKASRSAFLVSLLLPLVAIASLSEPDRSLITPRNLLSNPGAEFGKSGWTASGGTFTTTTAAANKKSGNAAFSWDSNGAGQTISAAGVTVTSASGLNADFYGACYLKCASGTCTHLLELTDGTSTTSTPIVSSTTGFVKVSLYHPGSGTMTFRLKSVAADEPVVYFDDCREERADEAQIQRVTQAGLYGYLKYSSTASCTWSTTSTTFVTFSAVAACPTPTVYGNASAPATKIPAIKFTTLPAGEYQVVLTGRFFKSANGSGSAKITDGTTHSGYSLSFPTVAADTGTNVLVGKFSYTTPQTNIQFQPLVLSSDGNTMGLAANAPAVEDDMEISVYRFPTAAETVSALDQLGTSWSGYHGADCQWIRSSSGFANPTADATCTFAELHNSNFGSVTSYLSGSDKLPGIVFTPKKAGTRYYVCAGTNVTGNVNNENVSFQLTDGTNVLAQSFVRLNLNGASSYLRPSLCGIYTAPSTSSATIRVELNPASGNAYIDSNNIARTIDWSVFDLSSLGAVSFKGVPTSGDDFPRIESARITNGGSCAVDTQSAGFITATPTHPGTGQCAIVFAVPFSVKPRCVVQTEAGNVCSFNSTPPTTAGVTVSTQTCSTASATDQPFEMICMSTR